jgi:hypothetical protein
MKIEEALRWCRDRNELNHKRSSSSFPGKRMEKACVPPWPKYTSTPRCARMDYHAQKPTGDRKKQKKRGWGSH